MNLIKSLPLEYLVANFYPHLYGLHTLSEKVCNAYPQYLYDG